MVLFCPSLNMIADCLSYEGLSCKYNRFSPNLPLKFRMDWQEAIKKEIVGNCVLNIFYFR